MNRLLAELPDDFETPVDAEEAARRMFAALPRSSRYDELVGPFYDTAGACAVLGGIRRQAVAQRADRGTILRVVTGDRRNLYPVFQFDAGIVKPEVRQLLRELARVDDA